MAQAGTTKKIMIVDDVESNRFVLRDIITDMGYQPILTENGVQALKFVDRFRPNLIILDIAMPEMDGYEVCRQIKSKSETRNIPIVFISAFDEPEDIVKGFALGGEDYITKPFIPEVVRVRVDMHLRLADASHSLMEMNRQLQASLSAQMTQMAEEKKNVLYALVRVARENAGYDENHMDRLSANCTVLAEAMQLSKNYEEKISDAYIETIGMAAPICDLGNVAIPTEILQKQGALTEEEKKSLQGHTSAGERILRDISNIGDYNEFLAMSMHIAESHHENWDGSGYPNGKKGNEIPLSAQIVAIAGAYCSLTEDRSQRKAFSPEEALLEMEKEVGIKYNPELFDILKKISRQLK